MAFQKKKRKEIEINDKFFIFSGRWFQRTKDEKAQGAIMVEDTSVIPEEYIESWSKTGNKSKKKIGL